MISTLSTLLLVFLVISVSSAASGKELLKLQGHTGAVRSVFMSADGTRVISGSTDKSIRIWDAASGKELSRLEGHTNVVMSVCMSTDGTRVISGSYDKTVRIWDAASGKVSSVLVRVIGTRPAFSAVACKGKPFVGSHGDYSPGLWFSLGQ